MIIIHFKNVFKSVTSVHKIPHEESLVAAGLWNMNICASRLGQKQRFVCSDD